MVNIQDRVITSNIIRENCLWDYQKKELQRQSTKLKSENLIHPQFDNFVTNLDTSKNF